MRRVPVRSTLVLDLAWPLLVFAALALGLSWPIARDFTTRFASDGAADPLHNIWILWHTQQALLGHGPLLYSERLYYPQGVTLLVNGIGPTSGLLALPFWPRGPAAAYNGTLLLGVCLTGYCMYLLARDLGLSRGVALFAGVSLLSSSLCLAGLSQSMDKTFLGLLPLGLLAFLRALDPHRHWTWTLVMPVTLLLAALVTGWQFVQAGLAMAALLPVVVWRAPAVRHPAIARRLVGLGLASLVVLGPLLGGIVQARAESGIHVNLSRESTTLQPDLVEFFLPSQYSRFLSDGPNQFLEQRNIRRWIETAVSLSYTGLALCLLALFAGVRGSRRWLGLTALFVVLALGPSLRVLGQREFTSYGLALPLPYALLTALPGLDFMRTPGRFMMLGFVVFGLSAAFGLAWLTRRFPARAGLLTALACGLVLFEAWPRPWPQQTLPPPPPFYQQLAQDPAMYGVFDLPHKNRPNSSGTLYSAPYMIDQLTHRKGIASGYISRIHAVHPVFPCLFAPRPVQPDVRVNGQASNCLVNAQANLARNNYRYVVWHKPRPDTPENLPGSQADRLARELVNTMFGAQPPIIDDEWTRVYAVDAHAPTTTVLQLGDGWYEREEEWRWATSPADLLVVSPTVQKARIELSVPSMHDPARQNGAGQTGRLWVETSDSERRSFDVGSDGRVSVPVELSPGLQTITLRLETGNFSPRDYGQTDGRILSFAVSQVDLRTE